MKVILAKGIIEGVRSEVMGLPGTMAGEAVVFLIAGATLAEAAYAAFASAEAKAAPDSTSTPIRASALRRSPGTPHDSLTRRVALFWH